MKKSSGKKDFADFDDDNDNDVDDDGKGGHRQEEDEEVVYVYEYYDDGNYKFSTIVNGVAI